MLKQGWHRLDEEDRHKMLEKLPHSEIDNIERMLEGVKFNFQN